MIGYGGDQETGGNSTYKSGEYALGSGFGSNLDGASGGGGYYGGGESRDSGAGGGSGFIGKVKSINNYIKKMAVYECQFPSTDPELYTVTTSFVSDKAIPMYAKSGNGYAIITLLNPKTNIIMYISGKFFKAIPLLGSQIMISSN